MTLRYSNQLQKNEIMKVNGRHYRSIWMEENRVYMINQNLLPFSFEIYFSDSVSETCLAIKTMITRGAGSIGAAAAYGMVQAINSAPDNDILTYCSLAKSEIDSTRPTAANLFYATKRVYEALKISKDHAINEAYAVANESVEHGKLIGHFGEPLICDGSRILTHCNAGWLGLVDYGSALAPIYTAYSKSKNVFVYIDETRPRSQGGRLTAWELQQQGIPHAVISDNAGAYYMSKDDIDIVITGADRIAANGDTANKTGTLEKAIAAKYFNIPFYIAAPTSTFDISMKSGKEIPIEQRQSEEQIHVSGLSREGELIDVLVVNPGSGALNPAFDITPADLITGIITEKGIIKPSRYAIEKLLRKVNR